MATSKKTPAKAPKTAKTAPTTKKVVKPKAAKVAKAPKAPKPAAKPKAATGKANRKPNSPLYLSKPEYDACIEGMMAQGLDRDDAVQTLKVGIRQANGRPVPPELLGHPAVQEEAELAEA